MSLEPWYYRLSQITRRRGYYHNSISKMNLRWSIESISMQYWYCMIHGSSHFDWPSLRATGEQYVPTPTCRTMFTCGLQQIYLLLKPSLPRFCLKLSESEISQSRPKTPARVSELVDEQEQAYTQVLRKRDWRDLSSTRPSRRSSSKTLLRRPKKTNIWLNSNELARFLRQKRYQVLVTAQSREGRETAAYHARSTKKWMMK